MDIYEARLRALQRLLKTRFADNQAAFAQETGISASYVNRMLKEEGEPNRKRIGEDMAQRIEETLNLQQGTLVSPLAGGPQQAQVSRTLLNSPDVPDRRRGFTSRTLTGGVALAVMDIEASMGHGVPQLERETVVTNMVVDENWLRRNASFSSPENLALVTGKGDSMRPTFEDGDALLVDRGVTNIKVDSIYVLSLRDELYIKRLQRRPDGSILMISDNRAYEPYHITNDERDLFRVLGRVVMSWNARRV